MREGHPTRHLPETTRAAGTLSHQLNLDPSVALQKRWPTFCKRLTAGYVSPHNSGKKMMGVWGLYLLDFHCNFKHYVTSIVYRKDGLDKVSTSAQVDMNYNGIGSVGDRSQHLQGLYPHETVKLENESCLRNINVK